jgi:hypothetical protein
VGLFLTQSCDAGAKCRITTTVLQESIVPSGNDQYSVPFGSNLKQHNQLCALLIFKD